MRTRTTSKNRIATFWVLFSTATIVDFPKAGEAGLASLLEFSPSLQWGHVDSPSQKATASHVHVPLLNQKSELFLRCIMSDTRRRKGKGAQTVCEFFFAQEKDRKKWLEFIILDFVCRIPQKDRASRITKWQNTCAINARRSRRNSSMTRCIISSVSCPVFSSRMTI